jgi:RimJ/RimL family protein N-acetyltransferase
VIDFGHGVTLRALLRTDKRQLRFWRNDYSIWKWCRQNTLLSDVNQDMWFESQAVDPKIKMFMIQKDGDEVGVCGLTDLDLVNCRAEFSLYIAPLKRGKGYASAGLKTLFSHGFSSWPLRVIWGESFQNNPAMMLFQRLGMNMDGIRRDFYFRDGKWIDAYLYSLTREEWLKSEQIKKVQVCSM